MTITGYNLRDLHNLHTLLPMTKKRSTISFHWQRTPVQRPMATSAAATTYHIHRSTLTRLLKKIYLPFRLFTAIRYMPAIHNLQPAQKKTTIVMRENFVFSLKDVVLQKIGHPTAPFFRSAAVSSLPHRIGGQISPFSSRPFVCLAFYCMGMHGRHCA